MSSVLQKVAEILGIPGEALKRMIQTTQPDESSLVIARKQKLTLLVDWKKFVGALGIEVVLPWPAELTLEKAVSDAASLNIGPPVTLSGPQIKAVAQQVLLDPYARLLIVQPEWFRHLVWTHLPPQFTQQTQSDDRLSRL